MVSELVVVSRPVEHVALVTIDRPKALNALNMDVLAGLEAAFASLVEAGDVRCAVLTGAGEKAFVAGRTSPP